MSAVIRDEIEAAARALARHKHLDWHRISPWWQAEQRAQARVILDAARQARSGGYRHAGETDQPDLFHEGEQT